MKVLTQTFVLCQTLQRQAILNTAGPFLTCECEAARVIAVSRGQIDRLHDPVTWYGIDYTGT